MFLLIQKPIGISSFTAIAHIRKRLGIKKIGHTGTLDPLATGLLLVATGASTKLIPYIDKARKTYVFTIRLDGYTDSGDLGTPVHFLEKELIEKKEKTITIMNMESLLQGRFHGVILQTPPAYSALSIDGKRAYELAREGKEVFIPERRVEIFSSKIISFSFPEVTLEMEVSVGTYIRSIARDFGECLGLSGYITMLHRSKIAHLDESWARNPEDILESDALSYQELFPEFQTIAPSPEICEKLRNGLKISNTMGLEAEKRYFVQENGKYMSLVELRDEEIRICTNALE